MKPPNKICFLFSLTTIWTGLWLASAEAAENKRLPNVIVFLADDQGINDASPNPHTTATYTPNLDRLAEQGILFTAGYASASMCTPSRVGLLSGRAPARFGIYNVGGDAMITWPKKRRILPQILKTLGYQTGMVGKWHCGGDLEEWDYNHPLKRGFDRFWGFMGSTHDYFDPMIGSGVNGAGYWSCGYSPVYDQDELVRELTYLTKDITSQSVEFIHEHRDRPFFLYVSHHCPHVPLQALRTVYEEYTSLGYGENTLITRAMQEVMDASLGRILDELDRLELRENTLVIYTSDNGGSERSGQLNGHLRGGKFSVLEGGIRVPMLISWPEQLSKNVVYGYPVSNLDLLPTILAAAEAKPAQSVDGVNLLPYLRGDLTAAPHQALYWKQPEDMGAYAIRSGDWKLVFSKLGRGLFNLRDDPGETRDLRSKHPNIVSRLQKMYTLWDAENQPSAWTHELNQKYFKRHTSGNPLENQSYRYRSTFGDQRK